MRVLGEPRSSRGVLRLERTVRDSARVRALLSLRNVPHRPGSAGGIYRYWQGIHWVLTHLVDLGYPSNDPGLAPLIDRALAMWTDPRYERTVDVSADHIRGTREGVPRYAGLHRRCASQQGYALLYASELVRPDERADLLADLLERWQWDDGGWNCSPSAAAHVSSFMETLSPMRGLNAYARRTGSRAARRTADRAAEVFLERRLFRRRTNGHVMRADFLRLHYPLYWHYDILGGLKGIAELGRIRDPRCREALDWLEARELPGGGWPCERRFYRTSKEYRFGCEFVDWGRPHLRRRNEWVTTDALYVLGAAGRLAA